MKKLLICLALILALAVAFAACNNNEEPEDTTAATEAPTTEAQETTASTTEEATTEEATTEEATTETSTTETTEAPTTVTTEEPTTEITEVDTEYEQNSVSMTAEGDVKLYSGFSITESELPYSIFTDGTIVSGDTSLIQRLDDGTPVWTTGGLGAFYRKATGKYIYTIDFHEQVMDGSAAAFIRGSCDGFNAYRWPDPNYYGPAGNGQNVPTTVAHGAAGIYFNVDGGDTLQIVIKSWNSEAVITPIITTVRVPGVYTNISVVDLGDVIYFLTEGKTCAKIELFGTNNIDKIPTTMVGAVAISTWDGQYYEVSDPLIANDMLTSDFGISMRNGAMHIEGISYGSAKDVVINDSFDEPTVITLDKGDYIEGDTIGVTVSTPLADTLVGIYKGDALVMYYTVGQAVGFIPGGGENIIINDETLKHLPEGDYVIRVRQNDEGFTILKEKNVHITSKLGYKSLLDAEWIADALTRVSNYYSRTWGNVLTLQEDNSYITITMDGSNGGDYNQYILHAGVTKTFEGSSHFAIRYRTTCNAEENEIFIGTTSVPFGGATGYGNPNQKITLIADGEWNTLYINFEEYGIFDMSTLNTLRLDLLNKAAAGSSIDIAWMGFFNTKDAVDAYSAN